MDDHYIPGRSMSDKETGFLWRSQSALVVVAAGATLSLNDFLTFPIMVTQNGGGAFLVFYILFLFLLGLPLMICELLLGRVARADLTHCFESLASQYKASVYWKLAGLLSVIAAVLIISTFSVIAGWTGAYFAKTALGVYNNLTMDIAGDVFDTFLADSEGMAFWHTLFVIVILFVASQPVKVGMQKLFCILLPVMLVLLVAALVQSFYTPGLTQSIEKLLYSDFSLVSSNTPLLALQRAFYTLTLGLGVMVAIGRYMPSTVSLGYSAGLIITVDLLFSILIGLVINAMLFSSGTVAGGMDSQFAFKLLPVVFAEFEFGQLFGTMFFLLLVIAALTTSVALMESPIGYLQRRYNYSRLKAAAIILATAWVLGMGTVLSYSVWQDDGFTIAIIYGDEAVRPVNNAGFHDVLIFFSSYLIQPLAALFLCLFVAWVIPREVSFRELALPGRHWYEIWNYLIRYITPMLLLVVLLKSLGVF